MNSTNLTEQNFDPLEQLPYVDCDGKKYHLLGTAHISARSCEEVESAIRTLRPGRVLVELDPQRLESLRNPDKWLKLDVREVIRKKQLPTLIANLILSSYQRRMGGQTGVRPGAELLRAVEVCEELEIPYTLGDRPIKATLRRLWASVGLLQKGSLLMSLFGSMFDRQKVDEEQLAELRNGDAMTSMLTEMDRELPQVRRILIDERDSTMSEHMMAASESVQLAVVGAGHVPGITRKLQENERCDVTSLELIPKGSIFGKILTLFSSLVLLGLLGLFLSTKENPQQIFNDLQLWVLCTSGPALVASLFARAHWLVCVVVTVLAPIAAFLKVIPGPKLSLLAAGLQAYLKPPTVADMEDVAEHLYIPRKWWSNLLLRIFLVFTLPGLSTVLGAVFALYLISKG